jgi:hypothetical protein
MKGWLHSPEGIPPAIQEESDGSLNIHDIDVWMWLRRLGPKHSKPLSPLRSRLHDLFSVTGQWWALVTPSDIRIPVGDTMHASITGTFPIQGRASHDIPLDEIAGWLARHAGLTKLLASRVENFVQRGTTGAAFSAAARIGQRKQATAARRDRAKWTASLQATRTQLDQDLVTARGPSPADDPAAEEAFRQEMGIDIPVDSPANDPGPSSRVTASAPPEAVLQVDLALNLFRTTTITCRTSHPRS